jgi:type IV secretory pathway ATPase VirB11/archaellum biosynthesis ATPase
MRPDRIIVGECRGTGASPKVMERLKVSGINLPGSIFEEVLSVNL